MTDFDHSKYPGVHVSTHPLVAHKLHVLRDVKTDSKKFREVVRELGALLTYEATMDLKTKPVEVTTPLTTCIGHQLQDNIGLIPILRAGLGMTEGVGN